MSCVDTSVLGHGVRVSTQTKHDLQSVSIAISIRVGSDDENEQTSGLSHFIEHMLFKGTTSRAAKEIAEQLDSYGAFYNACTSKESTMLYCKVRRQYARPVMDILLDVLLNSTFHAHEIEQERKVILQEILENNDSPEDTLYDLYLAKSFADQQEGRSILGSEETVKSFVQRDFLDFLECHYTAHNMVIGVAGNISHEEVLEVLSKKLDRVPKKTVTNRKPPKYLGGDVRLFRKLDQVHLMFGFPGCHYHHPQRYAYQVLATVLGGSMSSRLFQEVREKRGLAYSISAFHSMYCRYGMMAIAASSTSKNISELMHCTLDQIHATAHAVSDEELMRAKNQIIANVLLSGEDTLSCAIYLTRCLMRYQEYLHPEVLEQRILSVTTRDVQDAAQALLGSQKHTLGLLGAIDDQTLDYSKLCQKIAGI